jgi:hypothetical protein
MIRVRLTELKNEKLSHLGDIAINENLPLPVKGDSLYYKGVLAQYKVVDRHFNFMTNSLYDVELFVKTT